MPRIEVEPGQLFAGAGRQQTLSATVLETAGRLQSAGHSAADAAGEAGAAGAIAGWATMWATSLASLGGAVGASGASLGSAGDAYTVTDATAIPR
jgi:hypothetical protein